jgi:osmotically-inducible protein OsmY
VTRDPERYVVAHVREALAKDPRTNELNVEISVAGDSVFLTGPVTSIEHQAAVTEVVVEVAGGYEVHNHTSLAELGEPAEPEELP